MHMIPAELTGPRLPQCKNAGIDRSVHVDASKLRGQRNAWIALFEPYWMLKAYCPVSVNWKHFLTGKVANHNRNDVSREKPLKRNPCDTITQWHIIRRIIYKLRGNAECLNESGLGEDMNDSIEKRGRGGHDPLLPMRVGPESCRTRGLRPL